MSAKLLSIPRRTSEVVPQAHAYCFSHAGAGASAWNAVVPELTCAEVRAVRLPGRESRIAEPGHRSVDQAAAEVAAAIMADPPPGDLLLVGSCLGSMVALAVARELTQRIEVRALVLVRQPVPRQVDVGPSPLGMSSAELRGWLRDYQLTPAAILDNDLAMEFFEPTLRADLAMADGYAFSGPPIEAPVFLVGSRGVPPQAEPAAWTGVTTGPVEAITLDLSGDPLCDHPVELSRFLDDLIRRTTGGLDAVPTPTVREAP